MFAANNRFHYGNYCFHLGNDHWRPGNDRRCSINDRVWQSNGSLQHENDRRCCMNNRFRGGEDRVIDRVDRRRNGNTGSATVNDYRTWK